MDAERDTWGFAEGEAITPDLTAVRRLGGGRAYDAYVAFDEITYSPVVVKVVRPGRTEDAATIAGLRREVDALAAVNHPVVVRALRHDLDGARPHVVLEHIDGPRLSTLLRRHGPLTEQQYLPLAIDIAAALHYLRRVGYVHLDIKPSNIVMGAPARLIDLSIARPAPAAREAHPPGRHRPLPLAGAGRAADGGPARPPERRLGAGGDPLRGGDRRPAVPGGRARRRGSGTALPAADARARAAGRPGPARGGRGRRRRSGARSGSPAAPGADRRPAPAGAGTSAAGAADLQAQALTGQGLKR